MGFRAGLEGWRGDPGPPPDSDLVLARGASRAGPGQTLGRESRGSGSGGHCMDKRWGGAGSGSMVSSVLCLSNQLHPGCPFDSPPHLFHFRCKWSHCSFACQNGQSGCQPKIEYSYIVLPRENWFNPHGEWKRAFSGTGEGPVVVSPPPSVT